MPQGNQCLVAPVLKRWLKVAFVLLLLLSIPRWLSQICSNIGLLYYRDFVTRERALNSASQLSCALDANLNRANAWLRRASLIDPGNFNSKWGALRAALCCGDSTTAAAIAQRLKGQVHQHALAARDVMIGLINGGSLDDAWTLFERSPTSFITRDLRDKVALAYLQTGNTDVPMLERIHQLRSEDLFVNYHLWKRANEDVNYQLAAVYRTKLVYFPTSAITPMEELLLDYSVRVIPDLLAKGIWEQSTTLNVVSYLVWQHFNLGSVESLLQDLVASYPHEAQWFFYLAELYHRRGDWNSAQHAYEQGLAIDPNNTSALLRLGMINEARCVVPDATCDSFDTTTIWYHHCYESVFDDVIDFKQLSEDCAVLDSSESDLLREQVAALTDDRHIVAALLQLPVAGIDMGPNLVKNGGFEVLEKGIVTDWEWSDMFGRPPFNEANFIGEIDTLLPSEGTQNVRINGFWVQQEEGKSRARAGFWQRAPMGQQAIILDPDALYLVSFDYRTINLSTDAVATIWVSDDPRVLWLSDRSLPPTNGLWRHFLAIGWNCSGQRASIAPLVRLFGVGQVEFDAARVQLVRASESISTCGEPIFHTP